MIIFMMLCIVNSRKVMGGRVATLFHFNIRYDTADHKAHPFDSESLASTSSAVGNRSVGQKSMG